MGIAVSFMNVCELLLFYIAVYDSHYVVYILCMAYTDNVKHDT